MSDGTHEPQVDIEELVKPRFHRAELLFGIAAFVIALFLLSQIGSQLTWKSGSPFIRQPGFFATISIIGMLGFGALELYSSWKRQATDQSESISGEVLNWAKGIEFAVWFIVYVYAVPYVGYIFATMFFCLLMTLRLGYREKRTLIAAVLVGIATVVVFKGMLSVKIPGGVIYEHLPDTFRNFMILYL